MGYTDSPKRRGLPRSVAELDRSRLDSIIEDALFCKPFPIHPSEGFDARRVCYRIATQTGQDLASEIRGAWALRG